jgi:alpha-galactosidase/6-phospho-beta-glucosidase family protein
MTARVTIIGGGSYQWTPKLLVDFVNSPVLRDAELVLHDIDPAPLPRMVELVEHLAARRGVALRARGTTDRRDALDDADFVVVNISTGGFASMRHDLEIPQRHGVYQSVGDTVGPGGVMRALRNIPVFLDIARDVEARCPDAWVLNLTNPMTTICRALTRETPLKTIGLCHEITITQFLLSLLLDVGFLDLTLQVGGVNHLPFVAAVDAAGTDGLARLRDLVADADARADEPLPMDLPDGLELVKHSAAPRWTRGDLLANWRVKLELFQRFGVLPGAGDRHVAEFFPNFITDASGWGERWGFGLTSIETRERHQHEHIAALEAMLASDVVDTMPSGEMVAPVIECLLLDRPGRFPLNIPNEGQVADLPLGVTVESMCIVDGGGVRGSEAVSLPPGAAEALRRVSASQELTVDAAISGDRDAAFAAMLLDPLASRLDYDALSAMTDEMLAATREWLPQFSHV